MDACFPRQGVAVHALYFYFGYAGKPEIEFDAAADVVAVEDPAKDAACGEFAFESDGQGTLPGARKPREPDDGAAEFAGLSSKFPLYLSLDCAADNAAGIGAFVLDCGAGVCCTDISSVRDMLNTVASR